MRRPAAAPVVRPRVDSDADGDGFAPLSNSVDVPANEPDDGPIIRPRQ